MKSQIYLIRHGTTEANQKNLYYGATDIPLAAEGVDHLKKLIQEGVYQIEEDADLYTTGMIRTEETFFLIFGKRKHRVIPELREISFGEFEMKSYEELKGLPAFQEWTADKTGTLPSPKGESLAQFAERVHTGFQKLLENHHQKELSQKSGNVISVAICHGGTISAIMYECFSKDRENFYRWVPEPGDGFILDLKNGKIVDYQTL